jgi:hypothetical protein
MSTERNVDVALNAYPNNHKRMIKPSGTPSSQSTNPRSIVVLLTTLVDQFARKPCLSV